MTATISRIKKNVPLAPFSTFGLGGRAAYYVRVSTPEHLVRITALARKLEIPFHLIAGGSNIVFPDGQFLGLIIHFKDSTLPIVSGRGRRLVEVSAGVQLATLVSKGINLGLAGLEALSGIPGSVGGAIVGNAGAYGQSISDCLTEIQIFDGRQTRWVSKKFGRFTYRGSVFKNRRNLIVLRARFELIPGDRNNLAKKSREIIRTRNSKYVPGTKCPGSFFKNVLVKNVSQRALAEVPSEKIRDGKIPTGWLLESVGACGMRVGEIEVAGYHGNLLWNRGRGTTKDVKKLAGILKKKVYKKFGIELEEEVRYL